jgi:hypothetical protein
MDVNEFEKLKTQSINETIIACACEVPCEMDKSLMFWGVGRNHGAAGKSFFYTPVQHLCSWDGYMPRKMMTSSGRVVGLDEAARIAARYGYNGIYGEYNTKPKASTDFDTAYFDIKAAEQYAATHNAAVKRLVDSQLSRDDRWQTRYQGD